MRFNDALIGAALVLLAALILLYARTLPAIPGQDYGAAVFPTLVAWGLGGCGIVLAVAGSRRWEGAFAGAAWTRSPAAWGRLALSIGLVLLYVYGSDTIGFVPIAILILFALFLVLGTRWWVAALVAVAVSLVIYKAFSGLLLVPLPPGRLWV